MDEYGEEPCCAGSHLLDEVPAVLENLVHLRAIVDHSTLDTVFQNFFADSKQRFDLFEGSKEVSHLELHVIDIVGERGNRASFDVSLQSEGAG